MLITPVVLAVLLPALQQTPPPAAPAPQDSAVAAAPSTGAAQSHLDAGLAAFKKRRFPKAENEFRKAPAPQPQNPAPPFYLRYTYYKNAEPKTHDHPDKQKLTE